MHIPKISLHPKFAAVIDAIISMIFLWWLGAVATPQILIVWCVVRLLLWVLEVNVVYFPPGLKRWLHLLTAVFFQAGLAGLLIFVDWNVSWYLGGALLVAAPAVSLWLLPAEAQVLSFDTKPYRRWRFLMAVVSVAGVWGALSAATLFQLFTPFPWWLSIIGAAVTTGVAGWWWWEYGIPLNKRWWIAMGLFFTALVELSVAIFWWPLGHFVVGFILTWFWYVLWLMMRFYLSPEGIDFKKQSSFVITNAVLMILYLVLLVRWR